MAESDKKILGIDTDDVLVNLVGPLQRFHNRYYGTNVPFEKIHVFNLGEVWNCTHEQVVERIMRFYHSEEFSMLPPIEGSVDAITQLRERYRLIVVSSRPSFLLEETISCLDSHFPGCFEAVHLTDNFAHKDLRHKKSKVCLDLGIDTFIDDYIENAQDCSENGIRSLLFRRPWNLRYSDEDLQEYRITPVRNWQEVLQMVNI